jgi:hypothetical protein
MVCETLRRGSRHQIVVEDVNTADIIHLAAHTIRGEILIRQVVKDTTEINVIIEETYYSAHKLWDV